MIPSTRPIALGIHVGHDAAVSVCSPEGILFSLQEERVSRIKHHFGFPRQSLALALTHCGVGPADVGLVAFSSSQVLFPNRRRSFVVPAEGGREPVPAEPGGAQRIAKMKEKVRRT